MRQILKLQWNIWCHPMNKKNYRQMQGLLVLLTLLVLFVSFYLQYGKNNLQPCPLCIMQRGCVLLLLMLGLMGVRLGTQKRAKNIATVQMFFAAAGLFFASRQLWLQFLPAEQVPACLPGLDVLLQYFPWRSVAHALFWGAGDCAEIDWQWLGLSLPAWAGLYFLAVFSGSAIIFWRLQPPDEHLN